MLRLFRSILVNLSAFPEGCSGRIIGDMVIVILLAVLAVGCSSSPTSPTPVQPVNTPPVVVTPPVVTPPTTPARNPILDDPRFDASFYRMFALGTLEYSMQPLRRQASAPKFYLRTVHDNGSAIDAATLDLTAAAIINTTGALTGVFGVGALERGPASGSAGWITVYWRDDPNRQYCGFGEFGGTAISLYTNTPGCRCAGGPAVRLRTVKHELGHVLGFYHTDNPDDLMSTGSARCDQEPSTREQFHALVAYSREIGSLDP